MEAKIILELGYALLHLVKNSDGELPVAICNLRKEEPYIPLIRIKDNMSLGATEISINNERHILGSNDNILSQIMTALVKYVKEHPEIQEKM